MKGRTMPILAMFILGLGSFAGCDDGSATDTCGNGALDPGEECEPLLESAASCTDFGYTGGTLHCTSECRWDLSECTSEGDLPPGTTLDPTDPQGTYDIAAGPASTCFAPGNGTVWCWGMLGGLATTEYDSDGSDGSPNLLQGSYALPVKLCKGQEVGCLVDSEGTVWCWGYNSFGELGLGSEDDDVHTEAQASPSLNLGQVDDMSRPLACGYNHVCAIDADHHLWCWGYNGNGQVGLSIDEATEFHEPQFVKDGMMAVSADDANTCAVGTDGTVWCWGSDWDGMVGQGNEFETDAYYDTPVQVLDADGNPVTGAIDVDVGVYHVCAVLEDGRVMCWGRGDDAKLGTGKSQDSSVAVFVTDDSGDTYLDAIQVECGISSTCFLRADGTVWCWGDNGGSDLGIGYTTTAPPQDVYHPRVVVREDGTALTGVVKIARGEAHTCAVTYDGTLWCWGVNAFGQAGSADTDEDLLFYAHKMEWEWSQK